MTTPNIELGVLPEMKSYAAKTDGVGLVIFDSGYIKLPEGVSTITIGSHNTDVTVYLTTSMSSSARYLARSTTRGKTIVLSNVAVPSGQSRYLSATTSGAGDVGVTIITWPLA